MKCSELTLIKSSREMKSSSLKMEKRLFLTLQGVKGNSTCLRKQIRSTVMQAKTSFVSDQLKEVKEPLPSI